MAKQAKATATPYKDRRVTIPAGKKFVTFNQGDSVYIIEGDGTIWPQALRETIEKREHTAYEKGMNDGQAMQDRNMRSFTLEETLSMVLQMVRQYDAKGQNQILAVMMSEMGKAYQTRIKSLAEDINRMQDLLTETDKAFAGFQHIRNGAFEKINIA